jgi:betaine reductase
VNAVHYLNQFFAGKGGEQAAGLPPGRLAGAVGPGRMLGIEVSATLFCGDNYFNEHPREALEELLGYLRELRPDVLICGPSFASGRYGIACGKLARAAADLQIPSVCAMEPENPGVAAAKGSAYILPTGSRVTEMREVLPRIAALAERIARGEEIGPPGQEGYLPRGIRKNRLSERQASERAVDALLEKLAGRTITEVPLGQEKVPPAPPVQELSRTTIALVSEGGLVPSGNPDRLPSHAAEHWYAYSIEELSSFQPGRFQVVHGGFNTTMTNQDPNRLLPLDALRALETKGMVGRLHPKYYVTTGNSTSLANAARMGTEIAADLKKSGVLAALLVGT